MSQNPENPDKPIDPASLLAASFFGRAGLAARPDWLHELAELMPRREVKAGEHIFRENDKESYMALIAHGEVDIVKTNVHLRKKTIVTLREGDLLGEMSFVDGGARSAGALARTGVSLFILSRGDFEVLAGRNLALAHAVLRAVAGLIGKRLKETSSRVQGA